MFARKFFLKPPKEMKLPPDTLPQLTKQLYGLLEAGVHWLEIYYKLHSKKLEIQSAVHDLCFLFTRG